MFDFLTDEVFQIVVISALFLIGVILFMLYRRPIVDTMPSKNDVNSEKMVQFLDDIDYRLDKINKKLDDLANTFVNGLIMEDDASSQASGSSKSSKSSQSSKSSRSSKSSKTSKSNLVESVESVDRVDRIDRIDRVESVDRVDRVDIENTNDVGPSGTDIQREQVIYEEEKNIDIVPSLIVNTVVSHINSLNYDGIEFSDIPNFSTDTSMMDEEEQLQENGKDTLKHISKRIIQS